MFIAMLREFSHIVIIKIKNLDSWSVFVIFTYRNENRFIKTKNKNITFSNNHKSKISQRATFDIYL